MINENNTIQNLDDYLNDFLHRDKRKDLKPLSALDIECLYLEHLAKAYGMVFDAIQPGSFL